MHACMDVWMCVIDYREADAGHELTTPVRLSKRTSKTLLFRGGLHVMMNYYTVVSQRVNTSLTKSEKKNTFTYRNEFMRAFSL